jgi:uncharacterized membrane protein YheB (UPF0754 family)
MLGSFFEQHMNLLMIPIISAFVGYGTNFLAVKMMFYPIKFVGIRPIFGWQGIIPSKAQEMAEIEVSIIMSKLMSLDDIVTRIDPDKLAKKIHRRLKQSLRVIINDAMKESSPAIWSMLPGAAKHIIFSKINASLPTVVPIMVKDIQHNIRELVDLREIIINRMVENPEIINEIFLKVGEKEFTFIERSGLYFGLLLGIPTMIAWFFYETWWVLILGGLIVGYATNWIAIHMIFEPKHPTKIGPFTLQGLFLRRQKEAAAIYCEIIEAKLMNSEILFDAILKGKGSDQLMEILSVHVDKTIDEHLSLFQPYTSIHLGPEEYFEMKEKIAEQLFANADKILSYATEYATEAINLGQELTEKMNALTPEEFEGIIRPAYEADEWKLMLVGALLGMAAGYGQLVLLRPDLIASIGF